MRLGCIPNILRVRRNTVIIPQQLQENLNYRKLFNNVNNLFGNCNLFNNNGSTCAAIEPHWPIYYPILGKHFFLILKLHFLGVIFLLFLQLFYFAQIITLST